MNQWKPNKNSNVPIYKQIIMHYENLIYNHELLPGDKLPAERELAKTLNVNRSTITYAFEELRATGLVKSIRGSSTFVSEHLWEANPRRTPTWERYSNRKFFLPTLPVIKQVQEASQNPNIINFARGQLSEDLLPKEDLNHIFNNLKVKSTLQYADPKGDSELRTVLSNFIAKHYKINASSDEILITSGAQQALYLIAQCLLNPGDSIALENPSYTYSRVLFSASGLRMFQLPMDKDGLIPDEITPLYHKHKIRMIFTNPTYQNPTGSTLSLLRRKRLIEICEELRIPIIEDEPYRLLTLGGAKTPPRPLLSLHGFNDLVIHISTLSKIAAPGFRIGWIVAPKAIINRLAEVKGHIDYGMSAINQEVAKEYISNILEGHLQKINNILTKRRNVLTTALKDNNLDKQIEWSEPKGGYYLWGKFNTEIHDRKIIEEALKNDVIFMPGSVYGAKSGFARLTFAPLDSHAINEGVKRLAKTFSELNI